MRLREGWALVSSLYHAHGVLVQRARVAAFALAAASLVVHLLGPLVHSHAHSGSGQRPLASAAPPAVEMTRAQPPLVTSRVDGHVLGADTHLEEGKPGHTAEAGCGYLLPVNGGDQHGAPPVAWAGTVVAAPGSPAASRVCSEGERDPPDLVRDLQVIRV